MRSATLAVKAYVSPQCVDYMVKNFGDRSKAIRCIIADTRTQEPNPVQPPHIRRPTFEGTVPVNTALREHPALYDYLHRYSIAYYGPRKMHLALHLMIDRHRQDFEGQSPATTRAEDVRNVPAEFHPPALAAPKATQAKPLRVPTAADHARLKAWVQANKHYIVRTADDHWRWSGERNDRSIHPFNEEDGEPVRNMLYRLMQDAHPELLPKPLGRGYEVEPKCKHPACINPRHCEPSTKPHQANNIYLHDQSKPWSHLRALTEADKDRIYMLANDPHLKMTNHEIAEVMGEGLRLRDVEKVLGERKTKPLRDQFTGIDDPEFTIIPRD